MGGEKKGCLFQDTRFHPTLFQEKILLSQPDFELQRVPEEER